ncbi:hypothetical protein M422DRAFT_242681 [Sphaerobolus stellatus SS14]|nr:hypothetical protein M422DRAFT_242681 [Sphaerobolus stellatus SS14]
MADGQDVPLTTAATAPSENNPALDQQSAMVATGLSGVTASPATNDTQAPTQQPAKPQGVWATGLYEPTDWLFQPFMATKRPYVFSVHPEGVKFLKARLSQYDKIEGPQGLSLLEYDKRLVELRLQWKKGLSATYMSHWPVYNYTKLMPPNPSKE